MQKAAFITGSSKGIGKSITDLLLKNNYLVYGYSRTNNTFHSNFTFVKTDLSDITQVKSLKFPKLNTEEVLLINNAATIGEIVPLHLKSDNAIIKEFNLNIISATLLCKKFIKSFKSERKLLINISSGAANKPIASWSTYCATKAALDRLTEVISEEQHKNLTIFSVHPGIVDTNMQAKIRSANGKTFPLLSKFTNYYIKNELENTSTIAQKINYIIQNRTKFSQNIISIRDVHIK